MTRKEVSTGNLRFLYFALLATALSIFMACGNAAQNEAARLAADKTTTAELTRINGILSGGRSPSKIDIDSLTKIREQYPNVAEIRRLLQNAYITRGDWAAAEKLIANAPDAQLANADRINLAQIYLKQGKSGEAMALLKSITPSDAERVDVAALLGQAQFLGGDLDASAQSFESVRDKLVEQKRADDLAVLGTIYFRRGDAAKAIEVLKTAVDASPDNISANNMLARAYNAAGDAAQAEHYNERVRSISAKIAAQQKTRSRLVPLFYQLEDAYAVKDFDKVIALVRQIEPESDDTTKPTLYQYLAAAYKAQGKEADAKNALAEAQKFTQK